MFLVVSVSMRAILHQNRRPLKKQQHQQQAQQQQQFIMQQQIQMQQQQDLGSQIDDYFTGMGGGSAVTANVGQFPTTNPFAMVPVGTPMDGGEYVVNQNAPQQPVGGDLFLL
ncbi:hypothetical protein EV426DRAFT_708259 [Tirmania nivea]|nr:hypothetical protein EV426DRAFT_708259 [Tirmania nivea]